MKLNIDLLEKVKAHILSTPESFDMGTWAEPDDGVPCGTVACIAGRAAFIAHPTIRWVEGEGQYVFGDNRLADIATVGARTLGFPETSLGAELFYTTLWPGDLYDRWRCALYGSRERAEIAAERIDRYIAEYRHAQAGAVT